jgi:hypothetical protein
MSWDGIRDWFLGLGAQYGVDPLVFGAIYVGAIPFFLFFSAWTVRRLRAGRPATLPILGAGLCFISAYLYLAVAGRGIPWWVWALLAALCIFGAWSAVRDIRRKSGR